MMLVQEIAVPNSSHKLRVIFLCTGNSCRSQMAEGWTRALKGDLIEAFSAGTNPQGLNRLAVQVMAEVDVDISSHQSKSIHSFADVPLDFVVTVCDSAHESCPLFSGHAKIIHVGFEDPSRLAKNARNDDEALPFYRRIRDEIRSFIETLPDALKGELL